MVELPDLQTLFADDMQVSHIPMGSLTIPSVGIGLDPKVKSRDECQIQETVVVRRVKRKGVVLEGQMGFRNLMTRTGLKNSRPFFLF